MNLVPTNSVFEHAQGSTAGLPSITQYLSLALDGNESLRFYQSDMSSAFYLFRIPAAWNRMMCFDLSTEGSLLGLSPGVRYFLGCNVIPMGWGSAVSIMQEIADRLTTLGNLPESHKIRRTSPLPWWLVDVLDEGRACNKAWYHVYLDNFCAMEKVQRGDEGGSGGILHEDLEKAWANSGVLSSQKKKVVNADRVQELGAALEGEEGIMGPSAERLLKLLQVTMMVIRSKRLRRKWVQVVAGRWVHVFSFRRPGMVVFDKVWKYIALDYAAVALEEKVRSELVGAMCLSLVLHTNLRAGVSPCTSASDASMSGGAVGASVELTKSGEEFAAAGGGSHYSSTCGFPT